MSKRIRVLLGLITATLLVAGVAWAADAPTTTIGDRTLVPVDGAGSVTVEVGTQLAIVSTFTEPGWTVIVERQQGREVEARFTAAGQHVDVTAELEDGELRVEIMRRSGDGATSSTTTVTVASDDQTTSTTLGGSTSTTAVGGTGGSSTTVDDGGTTSTTLDDTTTSTTAGGTTSTTSGGSSSTSTDDGHLLDLPDGTKTLQVGSAGSVTVAIKSGALELVSVQAAAGWSYAIEKNRSDDIEVEFASGDSEAEIRVRVNDGRLEVRIESD